ncbi:MAG: flagellar motor protein, partial [Desulfobulbus sp.]|nr:flagellar motor protein [Desulfobulbus sp.]
MDLATLIGLVMGLGAVVGGAVLEGLHLTALLQPTAALIVLGGTFGAAFVSFPLDVAVGAFKDLKKLLANSPKNDDLITEICGYAAKARKNGIIALEQDGQNHTDRFMKKAISLSVDGVEPKDIRELLEIDLTAEEDHSKMSAEFFEAAGGYAPTIGIIGAVLGLIHVMSNLEDTSKLGAGIAVAFVATIYGLVTANIVCLPAATKIKHRIKDDSVRKEIII